MQISWPQKSGNVNTGFGVRIETALDKRQGWLIQQGLAECIEDGQVSYKCGYMQMLRRQGMKFLVEEIASQIDETWRA